MELDGRLFGGESGGEGEVSDGVNGVGAVYRYIVRQGSWQDWAGAFEIVLR